MKTLAVIVGIAMATQIAVDFESASRFRRIESDLAKNGEQTGEVRRSFEQQIADLRKSQEENSGRIGQEIQILEHSHDALKGQLSSASQNLKTAQRHSQELSTQISEIEAARIADRKQMEQSLGTVGDSINVAKSGVNRVDGRVGALEGEVIRTRDDAQRDRESWQRGLTALQQQWEAAVARIGRVEDLQNYDIAQFNLARGTNESVGPLVLRLEKSDPRKLTFAITARADDQVLKLNGISKSPLPIRLVSSPVNFQILVDMVRKDGVSGYLLSPKVRTPRGHLSN
jgi:chromosome segregation ATPase